MASPLTKRLINLAFVASVVIILSITLVLPQSVHAGASGDGGGSGDTSSSESDAAVNDSGVESSSSAGGPGTSAEGPGGDDGGDDTAPSVAVDPNAPDNDTSVKGEFDSPLGDPTYTEAPPTPPSCTPKTECGVTTHPNCSTTGTYDPLEPGCGPTLPTECRPSSSCGVSVLADCSVTGSYNASLPGCSNTLDFSITVSSYALSQQRQVASGAGSTQVKKRVDAALLRGDPASVVFSASGVPSGVTYSFAPPACEMTCSSILTLTISPTAPKGNHVITVRGTANGLQRSSTFTLAINCSGTLCGEECPTGWVRVGDSCLMNQCPQGYIRQGNTCVAGCQAGYFFCGTGENTGTLYQRSYTSAPACVARDQVIARCAFGCNASRGACNPTPESGAAISARPTLVRPGETTEVSWQAASVHSCVITGGSGERWGCTGSACASGTQTSLPIEVQTAFMLTCRVDGQPNIVKSVVVNVLPVFRER